jgi:hypothetical protein
VWCWYSVQFFIASLVKPIGIPTANIEVSFIHSYFGPVS